MEHDQELVVESISISISRLDRGDVETAKDVLELLKIHLTTKPTTH